MCCWVSPRVEITPNAPTQLHQEDMNLRDSTDNLAEQVLGSSLGKYRSAAYAVGGGAAGAMDSTASASAFQLQFPGGSTSINK